MTCPLTSCGLPAPDPIALADLGEPGACGSAPDPERFATLDELAAHPKGCQFTGYEDLARALLGAVSDKIDGVYGYAVAPCVGARCYEPGKGGRVAIDPLLRLDTVETRPCGCDPCLDTWTEVDLCDVVVGSAADTPPWRWIAPCSAGTFAGRSVRVTGAWGTAWPLHSGIRTAAIVVTAKLWQAMRQNNEIIANPADGSTRFLVPDFTMDELSLLPSQPRRYRACAA